MFPLSSFLHTLESDGIRLTVRDHDRIARVLGCKGGWTFARLRDVLLALLATDETQRELLGRRFDTFFAAGLPAPPSTEVDIAKIRAELRNFRPRRAMAREKPQRPAAKRPPPVIMPSRDPRRWQRLVPLLILVGLAVGFAWFFWPAAPRLLVTPPAHVLATSPKTTETAKFTLRNVGGGRLIVGKINLSGDGGVFEILNNTCEGATLDKDQECLVQIAFAPETEGRHQTKLHVQSYAGGFIAELTGHGKPIVEPPSYAEDNIDNLPSFSVTPPILKSEIQRIPIADNDTWRQAAALAGFFVCLVLIFGWYLVKARQPPEDKPPVWDETKPRHFPMEEVGGAPAPRLDDETLAHLADCMGYFRSERAGRRPDIDASVLATVEQGGIPRLVFHRDKELRHLIILEDGLAGEALALNPIAGELQAGMIRHGVSLISGRFYGDPAVFHSDSGRTLYLDDLEAARRSFLLLIFSAGSGLHDMGHTLENLASWPQVAWFDLRAPEFLDPAAALPARYGIPMYSSTATGLLQAFTRFLSEVAPQRDAAENAQDWHGPPPLGETPLAAYLETLLGDALPWAQACAMVQPTGSGLADGLRRKFYAHLPPERIERLAALPGTTRNAAGFCFSTAVLAELRHGFTGRHPSTGPPAAPGSLQEGTTTELPSQEAVLRFILAELEKSWAQAVQENQELQGSPAQLAWERHYQRVQLELEPDAALQRLAELAASPLGNAVKADLVHVVLPEDEAKGKQPAGIPLRKSPTANDSLQRLARLARKSGIPTLRAYPLKWWQWGLAAFLVLGFLSTAGWSGWAYKQTGGLSPRIEVTMVVELPYGVTPEPSDFRLLVDGKTWATGAELKPFRQSGQGLALVVCVDVSGTMKGDPLKDTKEALLSFIGGARREDHIALISFADHGKPESSFGDPRQHLKQAVIDLKTRGRLTRLYQTLYDSLDTFEGAKIPKRRRVIVISDGKDEGSTASAQNVITKSKALRIPIDAVGRGKIPDQYTEGLRGLARDTGGRFVHARPDRLDLTDAIDRIYRDLLETRSLVIYFKYDMDDTGQTTQNALIELQLPGKAPLIVRIPDDIPLPFPVKAEEITIPQIRSLFWLYILFPVLLVLCIGLFIWIRHIFRRK